MPDNTNIQDESKFKEIIVQEYLKCAKNPVYFLRRYCMIQHPVKGRMLFNLFDCQVDLINQLEQFDYNIVLKSRQLGISTVGAGYSLWLMIFHADKSVLAIATKADIAKNIITKVRFMYQNLPSWLREDIGENNKMSLRLKNGSQIKAITSSEDSGRSESLSLLLIDEAAFITSSIVEKIWTSAQQTLATGGKALVLSTPNGQGNWFHRMWSEAETGENGFNTIKLPCYVHPERDDAWRLAQDRLLGKQMAAQECDADFLSSGATLIEPSDLEFYNKNYICDPIIKDGIEGEFWIWEQPIIGHLYIISADVARGDGGDYSAFHILDILEMGVVKQVGEYKKKISTDDYARVLYQTGKRYNDALLIVENASIGWAVITKLIEYRYDNLYYTNREVTYLDLDQQVIKGNDLKNTNDMVPGFTTSKRSRDLMLEKLEECIREKQLIIQSKRTLNELYSFVWINNKAQSMSGYNDDLVMSIAIGIWVRETTLRIRQYGMQMTRLL